jgi:hypothetical protein
MATPPKPKAPLTKQQSEAEALAEAIRKLQPSGGAVKRDSGWDVP